MPGRDLPPLDLGSGSDDDPRPLHPRSFEARLLAVLQHIADELRQIRLNLPKD